MEKGKNGLCGNHVRPPAFDVVSATKPFDELEWNSV